MTTVMTLNSYIYNSFYYLAPKVWFYGGLVSLVVGLLSSFSLYWIYLQRKKLNERFANYLVS